MKLHIRTAGNKDYEWFSDDIGSKLNDSLISCEPPTPCVSWFTDCEVLVLVCENNTHTIVVCIGTHRQDFRHRIIKTTFCWTGIPDIVQAQKLLVFWADNWGNLRRDKESSFDSLFIKDTENNKYGFSIDWLGIQRKVESILSKPYQQPKDIFSSPIRDYASKEASKLQILVNDLKRYRLPDNRKGLLVYYTEGSSKGLPAEQASKGICVYAPDCVYAPEGVPPTKAPDIVKTIPVNPPTTNPPTNPKRKLNLLKAAIGAISICVCWVIFNHLKNVNNKNINTLAKSKENSTNLKDNIQNKVE